MPSSVDKGFCFHAQELTPEFAILPDRYRKRAITFAIWTVSDSGQMTGKPSIIQRASIGRQFSGRATLEEAERVRHERKPSERFPGACLRITNGMVRRLYQAGSLGIRGERRRRPMQLHTIGIDLGKTVFHLVGLNQRGEVVVRKKFSRKQLLHFTANLQVELIGMEACGGVHILSL